jgi:hypothetical protein
MLLDIIITLIVLALWARFSAQLLDVVGRGYISLRLWLAER